MVFLLYRSQQNSNVSSQHTCAARARSSYRAWRSVSPSEKLLSLSREETAQKCSWSSDPQRQPLQLPNRPPCSNLRQRDRYHSLLLFHKGSTRSTPARGYNRCSRVGYLCGDEIHWQGKRKREAADVMFDGSWDFAEKSKQQALDAPGHANQVS